MRIKHNSMLSFLDIALVVILVVPKPFFLVASRARVLHINHGWHNMFVILFFTLARSSTIPLGLFVRSQRLQAARSTSKNTFRRLPGLHRIDIF